MSGPEAPKGPGPDIGPFADDTIHPLAQRTEDIGSDVAEYTGVPKDQIEKLAVDAMKVLTSSEAEFNAALAAMRSLVDRMSPDELQTLGNALMKGQEQVHQGRVLDKKVIALMAPGLAALSSGTVLFWHGFHKRDNSQLMWGFNLMLLGSALGGFAASKDMITRWFYGITPEVIARRRSALLELAMYVYTKFAQSASEGNPGEGGVPSVQRKEGDNT